ncbi:LOW QUALITY PROTEIN: hypothetical protein Cgig2_013773 [Carnegiea gigantea]|uniref:Uncharacterized protein n=1 Tax=Carnegiea gigantea TaxID=171969 RepID=A0A9Q1K8P2_9CARY|nr:LOW QUALITY PROTEIN: hypothetical protein Cgig2_013773 [Carnegiea gigantea]
MDENQQDQFINEVSPCLNSSSSKIERYIIIFTTLLMSTNIPLDDKYRANVSDFENSKIINVGQTHVTTCVQGTYSDPNPHHFQSNKFTEKSDVCGFEVVLAELIANQKSIYLTKMISWILGFSTRKIKKNSWRTLSWQDNRNGRRQPTMKQVAMEIEGIRSHHVLNSVEPTFVEINEVQGSHWVVSMSFPDGSVAKSFSIDAKPLIANSF